VEKKDLPLFGSGIDVVMSPSAAIIKAIFCCFQLKMICLGPLPWTKSSLVGMALHKFAKVDFNTR
jgi:hypothetical protein